MLSYIPFLALLITGLLCFWFLQNADFSVRQKRALTISGVLSAIIDFALLYELKGVEHWLPTTLYIVVAYMCFWWFTRIVWFQKYNISWREAALVILWGQVLFPLGMAIVLIW
jgi:hypothetical protein